MSIDFLISCFLLWTYSIASTCNRNFAPNKSILRVEHVLFDASCWISNGKEWNISINFDCWTIVSGHYFIGLTITSIRSNTPFSYLPWSFLLSCCKALFSLFIPTFIRFDRCFIYHLSRLSFGHPLKLESRIITFSSYHLPLFFSLYLVQRADHHRHNHCLLFCLL